MSTLTSHVTFSLKRPTTMLPTILSPTFPQAASERYMDPVPAVRPPEDDLLGDDDDDDDFNPRMADGDAI